MQNTRKFWSEQPATLDSMFLKEHGSEIDQKERPEVLKSLPNFQGLKVLDLGSGVGRFVGDFAEKAQHVIAVDLNGAFLKKNKKNHRGYSNITYLQKDVMGVDFSPGAFDLIFISGLLMYLEEDEIALLANRISSWLNPKGYLYLRESLSPFKEPIQLEQAILRPFSYYQDLFSKKFKLMNVGSLRSYIELFGDFFRIFLLFQKD